jgi:hypothetical protein
MERSIKKISIMGALLWLTPCVYAIDYEVDYQSIFLNNKTKYDVKVAFCNENNNEQQQYPLKAHEHRFVRVKIGVMRKLFVVQVTLIDPKKRKAMKNPKTGALVMKEIDYEQNAGIIGLEISMKPDLDLLWRHEEDYVITIPAEAQ